MTKTNKSNILIIISIVVVAILGSIFVQLGMDWYDSLIKPNQWIPNIIIPVIWSIIYILFAVMLVKFKSHLTIANLTLLFLNGIFNILWCLTFFTLHLTFLGEIIIILNLILSIVLLLNLYRLENRFIFLSIYPIWLSLATSLNSALWILN